MFVPKKSKNHGVEIPDDLMDKAMEGCQILRHSCVSLSRMVMKPFKFGPRLGECSVEESKARNSKSKRRKRRDESRAQQERFFVPIGVIQNLLELFSPEICMNVFGVAVE